MNLEGIIGNQTRRTVLSSKLKSLIHASKYALLGLTLFFNIETAQSQSKKFLSMPRQEQEQFIDSLNDVAWEVSSLTPTVALTQLGENIIDAKAIKYDFGLAGAYLRSGVIHNDRGDYSLALKEHKSALKLYLKLNKPLYVADAQTNIGISFTRLGVEDSALFYYSQASKIYVKKNDVQGIFSINNSLGSVLYEQGYYNRAKEYYKKNLHLIETFPFEKRSLWSSNYALTLNNIGSCFEFLNEPDSANVYYQRALDLAEADGDNLRKAVYMGNLAKIYFKKGFFDKSRSLLNDAILIDSVYGGKQFLAEHLQQLSELAYRLDDVVLGDSSLNKSLDVAKKVSSKSLILTIYSRASQSFEGVGDYKRALYFERLRKNLEDSIFSNRSLTQINNLEVRYRTKLKESENKLLKQESIIQKERFDKQRLQLYGLLGFGSLVLLSSLLLYRGNRKQKKLLREKEKAYNLLNEQKKRTDELNEKWLSSVKSGSMLQRATLPSEETLESLLPKSFLFYQPKDIVSGDFYYVKEISVDNRDVIYFGAFDATGHGVPGAFMTSLSLTLFDNSLLTKKIYSPNEIFDDVRSGILHSLSDDSSHSSSLKAGFDGVLCAWYRDENELLFASANNPLYLVRDGTLSVYGPDKMPVGKHVVQDPFNLYKLKLLPGDVIYIASDGFQDQFGGPYGKKFMRGAFRNLLLEKSSLSPSDQAIVFNEIFNEWKADYEQVDDVVLFGVKF